MKKQLLLFGLLCFLVLPLTYIGCTSKKTKENNAALLAANRDSIRQAEEAAAQLAAQQAQMEALAEQQEMVQELPATPQYSGYYVILGSFRDQNNAQTFLEAMSEVFPDENTEIYNHHNWKMVVLGSKFGTFSSAKSTWQYAKESLQSYDYENLSFGDEGYEDEGYEDQGGGLPQEEDEEYTEDYDEEYVDEEYVDEEYVDEEYTTTDSSPFYTPWILGVY